MVGTVLGDVGLDDSDLLMSLDEVIDSDTDEFNAIALFTYAAQQNCSDLHLKPGAPPKLRIHGELVPIDGLRKLTSLDTDDIRQQTMSDADNGAYQNRKFDYVYAYDLPGISRFRIIITKTLGGVSLVARKLVDVPPTFDDLKTLPSIRDLVNFSSGLILISGVTGSGKSTLMAAMINWINHREAKNIISIEDPVEILHKDLKSNVIQRNLGTDVETFAAGVRDAMRQDPDVVMIGEIRDGETAAAALKAAETGHLVISTIHGKDSIASIGRMLDQFSGDELKSARNRFADVLRGIVCQKLVRSTDASGLLIPVNEIFLATHDIRVALEDAINPTQLRHMLEDGKNVGMQTFEQHFKKLVEEGYITKTTALAQAPYPEQMEEMLKNVQEKPNHVIKTQKDGFPQIAVEPVKNPKKTFSQQIAEEEKEQGVVVFPTGAAPDLPKAPERPKIYVPPRQQL